jgi:serine/threonine protein kinase, bacterial
MPNPLLATTRIDVAPEEFLHEAGQVFAEFGAATQDSGNLSYGVAIESGERHFVKTAGRPDDPKPFLPHAERVAWLRNAIELARSCAHPALPPLRNVIESPQGPLLVYAWVDGELLNVPRERRDDPESPYQRFRRLPAAIIERCLDTIYELHVELAERGWIAVDFYDGCLIYEFGSGNGAGNGSGGDTGNRSGQLHIVDLDLYRRGPFRNDMGRMFGSTRFMAPEEFERGALIDERTTVFTMGRTALLLLGDGSERREAFRGPDALHRVVAKACSAAPSERYPAVAAFYDAWRMATA